MNNEHDPDVKMRAKSAADKPYDQATCLRYPWAAAARITFLERAQRQYLPTFPDLVDRLSIVQLKAIRIVENREAYIKERAMIEHDIDLLLAEKKLSALDLRAIMLIMLANDFIWLNESNARLGERSEMLRQTHAVNGVRNTAKNVLAKRVGERLDLKVDCLAADLPPEMGNWDVFGEGEV